VIAADGTVRSSDTRYFLTSLDPDRVTARELLAAVRAHWQIENTCSSSKIAGGMKTAIGPAAPASRNGSRNSLSSGEMNAATCGHIECSHSNPKHSSSPQVPSPYC